MRHPRNVPKPLQLLAWAEASGIALAGARSRAISVPS